MNENLAFAPTEKKARVEIIPLIDVVFFLLATFVLFTLSLQKLGVLELPLPVGRPPDIKMVDTTVYVQVAEDGSLAWKEDRLASWIPIASEDLRGRFAAAKAEGASPRVLVIGTGHVSYGTIVGVLGELRKVGVRELSIETVPGS